MKKEILPEIPFDLVWKDAIDDFFEDFILFFLPKLYYDIDWTQAFVSLEQELHEIIQAEIPDSKIRETDKLVKVFLKNGDSTILYIHIEIQSFFEKEFSKRMYTYCRLIMRKYGLEYLTALAVFTGKKTPKHFDRYGWDCYGTSMSYQYNTYRIAKQNIEELELSDNPFALMVLANLLTINTANEYAKRFQFKRKLYNLISERGYDRKKFSRLLFFISDLMVLPQSLSGEFTKYLKTQSPSKEKNMRAPSKTTLEIVDALCEGTYHTTVAIERAEKEKAQAEKEKERKKTISKLYFTKKWTIAEVAEFLDLDTTIVEHIINNDN